MTPFRTHNWWFRSRDEDSANPNLVIKSIGINIIEKILRMKFATFEFIKGHFLNLKNVPF